MNREQEMYTFFTQKSYLESVIGLFGYFDNNFDDKFA